MVDFLITLFLGYLGVHKFKQGKVGLGFLYLFTFGLFGIGWIIDVVIALTKISSSPSSPASPPSTGSTALITAVSGYRSIHGIKGSRKQAINCLQQIACPGSRPGQLTADQVLTMCDSSISSANAIINDSKKIIVETEVPEIFYDRYSLILEKYRELTKFEPYVEIYGYQPMESLVYYQNAKPSFEKKMIDRCYNKALIKADSLKTDKGKRNQFIKVHETLLQYESIMAPENRIYLKNKFNGKL